MNDAGKCRVAAIQMTSTPDVEANLSVAQGLLAEAAGTGARLVVLPENFACMPHRESDRLAIAEHPDGGPIQSFLADCATRFSLFIVGGTIPVQVEGNEQHPTQTCLLYGDDGSRLARYDKIHLFDVSVAGGSGDESYRESDYTTPGSGLVLSDTPAGRLGLAVCYDLRFPGFFRGLLDGGMEVAVLPSAFTDTTGQAHWEVLLRARAIENLIWIIAAAQVGCHPNGRKTFGHSMIVDPWGTVAGRLSEGSGLVVADIDLNRQTKIRKDFPSLEHRRTLSWNQKND
jgi:nitrilase